MMIGRSEIQEWGISGVERSKLHEVQWQFYFD